ncbi:MAG: hypothetical protein FJ290_27995, partial [Planctomycetes bacterium]|nr:hypothetical protein [Planctomycetota bacterium]
MGDRCWGLGVLLALPGVCGGAEQAASPRLPEGVVPTMAVWGWTLEEFKPGGYRAFLDLAAKHSPYNLITTTIRAPMKEVTDEDVYKQIKEGTAYARGLGIRIAFDLDVRLARRAFQKAYPDELQEMLRLREFDLKDGGEVSAAIVSTDLGDHYTFQDTHYIPLAGRLVRVYSYVRGPQGIEPDSIEDITAKGCKVVAASEREVKVSVACGEGTKGRKACLMAAFTHLTPDVFSPHLLAFQREIIKRYADTGLAGVCKDEWGFPPCYDGCPAKNDYWFSKSFAEEYAKQSGGRDLVRDCLLMWAGEKGRLHERQAAINLFQEMCRARNGEIEDDFYKATKATFGPAAIVATHPTWYPYPGVQEFKKNGLDWWAATRDLAQTDEVTPYSCRTSLAKKWGSPLWVNMYYSSNRADYDKALWAHAFGGGRINYHPVYPAPAQKGRSWAYDSLLRGGLMRGECRVRLLNFITRAPLDCPVAVVFGHACAMNWAGPSYADIGMALTDALWRAGFPADLIPSSDIASLKLGDDGLVQYGPQRYAAVVLYRPEFERPETAAFFRVCSSAFRRSSGGGPVAPSTALFRVGNWTAGPDAKPFDGNAALPKAMAALPDAGACANAVLAVLKERGVAPQTGASERMSGFGYGMSAPPASGRCRLIDGTAILLAGAKDVSGDPIQETSEVGGHKVFVDAIGVVAIRLAADGSLEALAAGGLRRIEAGAFKLELGSPADLALWRDASGKWHGVLQDFPGPIPPALSALTNDWLRLSAPPP